MVIAGDNEVKRARRFGIAGVCAKCDKRGRLAARDRLSEIAAIGSLEALCLDGILLDLSGAEHVHAHATGFSLDTGKTQEGNIDVAVTWEVGLADDDKAGGLFHGFEKGDEQFTRFHFPICNQCALHLIDRHILRKLNVRFLGRTLRNIQSDVCADGCGIFSEAHKLRERAVEAQRQRRMLLFGLAPPGEHDGFPAFTVSGPPTGARELLGFGKESTVEGQGDARTRNFQRDAGYAGKCRRQGDSFFAGGSCDGKGDLQGNHGAASMREQGGELIELLRSGKRCESQSFAVELRFANEEPGRDWHTYPAVLQNVDAKRGTAEGHIGFHAKVVINAAECGIDRRRFRFALGGKGFYAQGTVFGHGEDHPAGRMRWFLRKDRTAEPEQAMAQTKEQQQRETGWQTPKAS